MIWSRITGWISRALLPVTLGLAALATGTAGFTLWRLDRAEGQIATLEADKADLVAELAVERIKRAAAEASARVIAEEAAREAARAAKGEELLFEIYAAEDADAPAPDLILRTVERLRGAE
ncbi:hypothetical protein N0B44_15525 [Roseibacterium beibuensis]|uniref:Uncharacterized protein n=1 Tax=[Roseibacterium] beibuensis TaxID=1193142 RepID=A0ABP9LCE5_9RHOB|nr:hypothetical protein [Roseibacterium beibuensis]MCS6624329.1 hypothetical protein [Roseibacterium beibuensis]